MKYEVNIHSVEHPWSAWYGSSLAVLNAVILKDIHSNILGWSQVIQRNILASR
jgi:hypothetical protein